VRAPHLMLRMVIGNRVMIGTVNAASAHFQMAVDDLQRAGVLWGDHVAQLITDRHPYEDFAAALRQHSATEIKCVIEWASS
jgi:hypothetical protein